MSTAVDHHAEPAVGPAADRRPARRPGRLLVALALIVVLVAAGAVVELTNPHGISVSHPFGKSRSNGNQSGRPQNGGSSNTATSVTTIKRQSLTARTSLGGTLGYSGDYTIEAQQHGTLTWRPTIGAVIGQGQVLYRVDGQPVILLYGSAPAWRALAAGADAEDVTGDDVAALNKDLVALRYTNGLGLDPASKQFSWATKVAIERLQAHLGVTQTGRFDLGQVVFLPTELRVAALSADLGTQTGGPVLKGTSTERQVVVNLDAADQSTVADGDTVTITLPNRKTTLGRVSSVGTVATAGSGSNSSPTVAVDITPTDATAAGILDQAPVQVAITTATVRDVFVVPVTALLDLAGNVGYAVEVVDADQNHHLVPVTLGLFDDDAGLVQISGTGVTAGLQIVVPAS